jgi:hypothetical protein
MDVGREGRPNRSTCKKCRSKSQATWKRNHPKVLLVNWSRHRAKTMNIPFSITADDFEIPEVCPVLGIELKKGNGKLQDSSPTLDRINPTLGYVRGNIKVISYKANRIKNNGSLSDLKAVVRYMESGDNTEGRPEREPVTTNTSDRPVRRKIESELVGDNKRAFGVIQMTAV